MNSGRIFGSIYFSNFDFDVENAISIIPLFTRYGFGIHKLTIYKGFTTVNLLYLILCSIQEKVEVIELKYFKLKNISNLQVFTGVSEFKRLKKLVVYSHSDKFFTEVFQNAPVLENLKLYHNFEIINGKIRLKKLSIAGDFHKHSSKKIKKHAKQTLMAKISSKNFQRLQQLKSN
jgi:hypothetical protein